MNSIMIGKEIGKNEYVSTDEKYVTKSKDPYSQRAKVKTVAFDTFLEQNKIDEVDFCKFDVEGAEDLILRSEGFRKIAHKIKSIEVEFHYPSWTSLVDYLVSLGYKASRYPCDAIVILFTR